MDIGIKDAKTFLQHRLDLDPRFHDFQNRQVRIHLQRDIQVDIATVGTTSLRLNFADFGNFHDGLLVVPQAGGRRSHLKTKGRLDKDIIGSLQDKESDDDSDQFIHNGIVETASQGWQW